MTSGIPFLHLSDCLQPKDIPLLFKVLGWPQAAYSIPFNPMLDNIRLAFVNPSKTGLGQTILSSDSTANEFVDIILRYVTDFKKPTNQMLAVKVLANIFPCDKGKLSKSIVNVCFRWGSHYFAFY